MKIVYHRDSDLLYISLDATAKEVVCQAPAEGIVVELGENDRIVGIEILDASKRIDLSALPALTYAEVA
jgi:uncharacterized protein YuzE